MNYLILKAENQIILERKGFSSKYVKGFNRGEERFNNANYVQVKRKVTRDPEHYDVKEQKNLVFKAKKLLK